MPALQSDFQRDGFVVVRQLFSPAEVARFVDHFMALRGQGAHPGDFSGVDPKSDDPLLKYPRMIHMHRWDEMSLRWLLDARIRDVLTEIEGEEPFAAQTMLYFKPPGARGQALHQDQAYLRARPGTCLAAWLALDDCDEANGCLEVVPGSHALPTLCTVEADISQSFTDVTVPVPEGMASVPVIMKAGDVLCFHGQLIHGSRPNSTADRFRRALIGHYISGCAEQVSGFYHPVLRFDGTVASVQESPGGGPCGILRERDGRQVVEMVASGAPTKDEAP